MTVRDSLRLEASLYELMLSLRNVAVYQTFQMVASHTVQNYIIHYTALTTGGGCVSLDCQGIAAKLDFVYLYTL